MTDQKLSLYIAGKSAKSRQAVANIERLKAKFSSDSSIGLDVYDLKETPNLALEHNILALPTLIREIPDPAVRVIGDLSDIERVWKVLND